jgi:acyl transferase domain-containing protein
VPASLHFHRPNPRIDFDRSPFFVNAQTSAWHSAHGPRRAGVNSLGIGGTNAFVALEEAPRRPAGTDRPGAAELLCLSAKTELALDQLVLRYREHFARFPKLPLSEVCYTTQVGRTRLPRAAGCLPNRWTSCGKTGPRDSGQSRARNFSWAGRCRGTRSARAPSDRPRPDRGGTRDAR